MPLATAATGIGKQVVTHAVRTWFGARRESAERDAELIDLVRLSVRDHFQRRKLVRQLEDLADQIAERMRPIYEHEFRNVADNERAAALLAVVDALKAADLTDDTLFAVDVDSRNLARLVRERVPVRRMGLAEPAERLYDAVLDESCMALVQVVKQLPAFEPRALTELLARFSQVIESIGEVLHRLPRTTLDAPRGSEHDEEFRARYLADVSNTLDELEQFGIDVRRYKPRTLVSIAYLQFLTGVADPLVDVLPEGWVHRQLSTGRALLLVDGVTNWSLPSGQPSADGCGVC